MITMAQRLEELRTQRGLSRPVSNFSTDIRGSPSAAASAGRLSPRWVRSSSSLCAMVIIDSFLLVHPWKHGVGAFQHSAAGLPLLFVGHYTSVAEK